VRWKCCSNRLAHLLVRAGELHGGVAEQAAARRTDCRLLGGHQQGQPDVVEHRAGGLQDLQRVEHARDVGLKRPQEQPALVAEQAVQASALQGQRVGKVLDRSPA
jgi:hypothetical protein